MASWDFRRFVKANPDVGWKLLRYLVRALLKERGSGLHAFRATE
jgi:hypothetical protein